MIQVRALPSGRALLREHLIEDPHMWVVTLRAIGLREHAPDGQLRKVIQHIARAHRKRTGWRTGLVRRLRWKRREVTQGGRADLTSN